MTECSDLQPGERIIYILPPDKRYRPRGLRLTGEVVRVGRCRVTVCLDHQPLTTRAVSPKALERA